MESVTIATCARYSSLSTKMAAPARKECRYSKHGVCSGSRNSETMCFELAFMNENIKKNMATLQKQTKNSLNVLFLFLWKRIFYGANNCSNSC